jgi:hypothetical protein
MNTNQQTLCPVGELAGDPHYYTRGTGKKVLWDVMGNHKIETEVCPDCAQHAQTN